MMRPWREDTPELNLHINSRTTMHGIEYMGCQHTGHSISPGSRLCLRATKRQFNITKRRKGIGINLRSLVTPSSYNQIARTILSIEGNRSELRKTFQQATTHFINQVLNRFAHKLVKYYLNQITNLLCWNIKREIR